MELHSVPPMKYDPVQTTGSDAEQEAHGYLGS